MKCLYHRGDVNEHIIYSHIACCAKAYRGPDNDIRKVTLKQILKMTVIFGTTLEKVEIYAARYVGRAV